MPRNSKNQEKNQRQRLESLNQLVQDQIYEESAIEMHAIIDELFTCWLLNWGDNPSKEGIKVNVISGVRNIKRFYGTLDKDYYDHPKAS